MKERLLFSFFAERTAGETRTLNRATFQRRLELCGCQEQPGSLLVTWPIVVNVPECQMGQEWSTIRR